MDDVEFEGTVGSILKSDVWMEKGVRMAFKPLFAKKEETDGLQEVHTPFDLCKEMLTKLSESVGLTKQSILVMFNLEFVDVLIKDFVVPPLNIAFLTDAGHKGLAALEWYGVDLIYEPEMKNKTKNKNVVEIKKKFDVVVGNPPYQNNSGNKGQNNTLWDKFLAQADNELVKEGGYICFVHPALWRKPNHPLQKHFLQNDLQYLEIHNEKDGLRMFGANTRYDWYVLRKSAPTGKTIIKGQDGKVVTLDLCNWAFIPNCEFELVKKMLAKRVEDRVQILNSSLAYDIRYLGGVPRRKWMSATQDAKYKYPCVYMVKKNNEPIFKWSCQNDRGHFGIPKVIYACGAGTGFWVDHEGVGMTQWASGIVDKLENLESIAKALRSAEFEKLWRSLAVSKEEVNTSIISLFRHDFWKEFLP